MNAVYPSPAREIPPNGSATTVPPQADTGENFLIARGLDPELTSRLGLKTSADRIEIPYIRNGETVYKKYRGIAEKTFSCDAGSKPFLYNFDCIQDDTLDMPVLITEGEFDCIAAIQAGHLRSVSVPNGSQGVNGNLDYLDEIEGFLRKQKTIILACDGDEKGSELLQALSFRLGRMRCKWLKYPKGCKDLNETLVKFGTRGVQETIRRAQWISVGGLSKMSDLAPIPYAKPYDIGIPGFEEHLNIRMGDLSVWTGVPSSGKSTFINDILCRIVTKHGLKPAIASFEQNPQQDHKRALSTWRIERPASQHSPAEKALADQWIDDNFIFIVPNEEEAITLEWVLEKAATAAIRFNCKIIVIDPWNEMDHTRPKDQTMTEYVGFAIKELKSLAKKYQVHVAIVAHPAKPKRDVKGNFPIPSLYDVADSAHFYNKADLGVIVHRSPKGDFVQVAKSRYHYEIGKPGVVDVHFSPYDGRYTVVDNSVLEEDEYTPKHKKGKLL